MSEAERKNTVIFLYISYIAMIWMPLLSFIYLLIKGKECLDDKLLSSHMYWQLGTITISFVISIVVVFMNQTAPSILLTIWVLYRMIKGVIKLSENEPAYTSFRFIKIHQ